MENNGRWRIVEVENSGGWRIVEGSMAELKDDQRKTAWMVVDETGDVAC